MSATALAARIRALDGTQPTFKQSPPMRCRSTSATFAPRPAAPAAATSPAVPAPTTTRLYRPLGLGFDQSGGWTFATSARLYSSGGAMPSASPRWIAVGVAFFNGGSPGY